MLRPGQILQGRYEVEAWLGKGGFAEVFRVRHLRLESRHALKVLHRADPGLRAQLLDEGRFQARLRHPNLVRVTDVIDVADGVLGLVMDLVEGPTLAALLAAGPLPRADAIALGAGILAGVAAAHAAGLVHRDLKPANVLIDALDGRPLPRVTDFGLARAWAGEQAVEPIMGTPGYMAPEQYQGQADHRADLFALGAILYELATGRRPFDARNPAVVRRMACNGEAVDPAWIAPDLPVGMARAITTALAPAREDRPADCAAMLALWTGQAPRGPGSAALQASAVFSSPATPSNRTLPPVSTGESAAPPRHNLLPERDLFVGRAADLDALAALIAGGARLVTVHAMGGMGKTRLLLRFGWQHLAAFSGGTWLCDLSEARDADGILYAVGRALEVPLGQEDPIRQLGHALAGRGPCLVILDNFEQVAAHAESTLGTWLDWAPEARFVVPSRERLNLRGEQVLPLPPLPLDTDALALFEARARAQDPRFALTEANRPDIAAIVEALDGLPLAIELAAARVRVLPPAALRQRLKDRLQILTGARRGPARQATLRAAIEGSWELLNPCERAAFGQCSAFAGSFGLDAAETVLDLSAFPDAPWPVELIAALVDKSLLRPIEAAESSFAMAGSLRDYAAEKLRTSGAFPGSGPVAERAIWARHGATYASFGTDAAVDALDRRHGPALRRARMRDLDNLVAACRRAIADGDGETAVATLLAAWAVLELTGPLTIADALAQAVLELSTLGDRAGGRAAFAAGCIHLHLGRADDAVRCLALAQARARAAGDVRTEGLAISGLGRIAREQGRMAEAAARFDTALALHRAAGHRLAEGGTLAHLGVMHREEGRPAEALTCLDAALALHRAEGDRRGEGIVLNNLGTLHLDRGEIELARATYEAALVADREVGNRRSEGIALGNLGALHSQQGRAEEARACYGAALVLHREVLPTGSATMALMATFWAIWEIWIGSPATCPPPAETWRLPSPFTGRFATALDRRTGSPIWRWWRSPKGRSLRIWPPRPWTPRLPIRMWRRRRWRCAPGSDSRPDRSRRPGRICAAPGPCTRTAASARWWP